MICSGNIYIFIINILKIFSKKRIIDLLPCFYFFMWSFCCSWSGNLLYFFFNVKNPLIGSKTDDSGTVGTTGCSFCGVKIMCMNVRNPSGHTSMSVYECMFPIYYRNLCCIVPLTLTEGGESRRRKWRQFVSSIKTLTSIPFNKLSGGTRIFCWKLQDPTASSC